MHTFHRAILEVNFGREYGFLVVFNRGRGKVGEMRAPTSSNKDDKTVYLFNITICTIFRHWKM
jgi:hypothetical protein